MKLIIIAQKSFFILALTTLLVGCGQPSGYPYYLEEIKQEIIEEAKKNEQPLIIWSAAPSEPNSAGGVSLRINFMVTAPETIKYLTYRVRGYNSVGDPTGGEIRASSYRTLEDVGPHRPGVTDTSYWGELYYNWSLNCVQITKLTVEYMSGRKKTYTGKALNKLFGPDYAITCKVV